MKADPHPFFCVPWSTHTHKIPNLTAESDSEIDQRGFFCYQHPSILPQPTRCQFTPLEIFSSRNCFFRCRSLGSHRRVDFEHQAILSPYLRVIRITTCLANGTTTSIIFSPLPEAEANEEVNSSANLIILPGLPYRTTRSQPLPISTWKELLMKTSSQKKLPKNPPP